MQPNFQHTQSQYPGKAQAKPKSLVATIIILVWSAIIILAIASNGHRTEEVLALNARADEPIEPAMEFDFDAPKSSDDWIIPIQKTGAGPELNAVVAKFSVKCIRGMRILRFGWQKSRSVCVTFSGQIDHETAGTWDPKIKGDGGCSTGLGQWNSCPASKRKAANGLEAQMDQFVDEMGQKAAIHPLDLAVCLHNSPAGRCAVDHYDKNGKWVLGYVSKVKRSAKLFN